MNRLSKNEEHIKKTLNEQEFSFDPAHWQDAEAMLDSVLPVEPKKKKRRFGFFWLVFTFLVASGGVFWWVYSQDFFTAPTTQKQWSADTTTNQETENEGFITEPETDSQYSQENNDNQYQTNEENNQTQYSPQVGGPPTLMAAQYSSAEQEQKSVQPKDESSADVNVQTDTHTPSSKKTQQQAKESDYSDVGSATPQNQKAQPKNNNPDKPLQADNGGKKDKDTDSNSGGGNDLDTKPTPQTNKGDQDNNTPPVTATPAQTKEQKKDELNSTSPNTPLQVATTVDSAVTSSNENPSKDEKKDTEKEKKGKGEEKQILLKNSLSPVFGSNYTRLLQPSGSSYNNRLYFGLLYNYYFNTRWQMAAGLGYSTVGVNGFTKQYTQQTYSFGVHTQKTIVSTQKLHYLEAPVLVRYALGQNISFVGGANINYLINTNNTLSQYSFASLSGETSSSSSATAYMQGLNRWDVQLQLGIEANFWKRMHLGLLANSGLMDVGINNYYNNTVFDRNRRLQLYFRYDIFRF